MPDFDFENAFQGPVIGIDEAGCGPWAGPVVAAATLFHHPETVRKEDLEEIDDSKKMNKKAREKVFQRLMNLPINVFCHATASISVSEIDQLNIRQATLLAMRRAYNLLRQNLNKNFKDTKSPHLVIVDGIADPKIESYHNNQIDTRLIRKGDAKSFTIAAASIIAKVTRDRIMTDLHREHPCYGWDKNAGYGTQHHRDALKRYGVTHHHRKSYAPIRTFITAP